MQLIGGLLVEPPIGRLDGPLSVARGFYVVAYRSIVIAYRLTGIEAAGVNQYHFPLAVQALMDMSGPCSADKPLDRIYTFHGYKAPPHCLFLPGLVGRSAVQSEMYAFRKTLASHQPGRLKASLPAI